MTKDWSENSPVFSPDGRTLYFLTCLQQDYPQNYKHEQYNLCSISFDPDKGSFGQQVDTLFNAGDTGQEPDVAAPLVRRQVPAVHAHGLWLLLHLAQ